MPIETLIMQDLRFLEILLRTAVKHAGSSRYLSAHKGAAIKLSLPISPPAYSMNCIFPLNDFISQCYFRLDDLSTMTIITRIDGAFQTLYILNGNEGFPESYQSEKVYFIAASFSDFICACVRKFAYRGEK